MIYSGFEISQFNRCVYFKKKSSVSNVYLLLYVDMLLASCDKAAIEDLKKQLKGKFKMKIWDLPKECLEWRYHVIGKGRH